MGWVRIDDAMPHHPKIIAAGYRGAWLFVTSLCYSNHYLTDGFVPDRALVLLTDIEDAPAIARHLVECGLFIRTNDGYMIHDYHEYQPTASKVKQTRTAAKERMDARRSPNVRANKSRTNREQIANNIESNQVVDSDVFADCSQEVQRPQSQSQSQSQSQTKPKRRNSSSAMNDNDDMSFDEFWAAYPVKKGKAAAKKAWAKISPDENESRRIIAAVRHQSQSWDDLRFVPHPTRWLNESRWEDETIVMPQSRNATANPFVDLLSKEVVNESQRNHENIGDFAIAISDDEGW